ncbi:LLM class flavin-dependent oxidoreductase [Egibacter rhizosphaerae]|uniref:LLM class flavin-dependent oxidoreductase n=1 Tax=Egibacter rhizosphaerae TaxID=1670831 RepID=A0A411YH34_9ACTN|nr:LLM class flavin-dependent oxidoreductase [Egibacter rhizosphaerae]
MRFGIGLPTCREGVTYPPGFAGPQAFIDIAQAAEGLGFSALWTNDHSTIPNRLRTDDEPAPTFYEPATTLPYLAAYTSTIRLKHGALVAPVRGTPVLAARQAATLDVLCQGRHTLGLCIGGYPEEYSQNFGSTQPRGRGRALDEFITLTHKLLQEKTTTFAGDHYSIENLQLTPKPVQPHLPIHYMANSDAGVDRAGRLADGWTFVGLSYDEIQRKREILYSAADRSSRQPRDVEICPQIWVAIGETQGQAETIAHASGEFRRFGTLDVATLAVGTPDKVASKLRPFKQAGAIEVGTIVQARTVSELIRSMELLSKEVVPAFVG